MTVFVYVSQRIRKAAGFKVVRSGKDEEMRYSSTVCEHTLTARNGKLFFSWDLSPVPEDLKQFVESSSCFEYIPKLGHREAGIYRFNTAECDLTPELTGSGNKIQEVYSLKITRKKPPDIRDIIHFIKIGHKNDGSAFRPDESYECAQGGKSRQQLEAEVTHLEQQYGDANFELERVRALLKKVEADYLKYRNQFAGHVSDPEKLAQIRTLADSLGSDSWPFCYKNRVAEQIGAILDSK